MERRYPSRPRTYPGEQLRIVDLQGRKVIHVIAGLAEPQGVGYEPASDTLYVANAGDGSVRLFRAGDFAETGRIELGEDADNIRMDLAANRVLVGYGSGAIAVIDAAKRTKIADLPLPAHPESFQLDHKTNQIFVNVPNSNAIVVLDGLTGQHKATWPLNDAGRNFPMAIDDDARRVLVGFRSPARLDAFSIGNGQNAASIELCGDTDDIFVDAKRHRIYASCGQGFLDVFEAREGGFRRSLRLPTVPGARTSYFVASIDRLFLAVRSTAAEPAAIWMFRPAP